MADDDTKGAVLQIGADLRRLEKAFEKAAGLVKDKTKKMKDEGTSLERFFGKPSLAKALDKTFDATRFKILDSGAARVGLFGSALEALGPAGLAAAAAVGALGVAFAGAREAAKFADDIADTANRLHVTTDALQEYRFAIHAAGGETRGADEALEAFSTTFGLAQEGLKKGQRAFLALGFTKAQIAGFRNADEALKAVTERIAQLPAQQQDAVIKQLGLEGLKPLIAKGVDEMERLRQKAHEIGIVMDADLVAKGGQLNDEFETLQRVIDVQLKSALVDLAPVMLTILQAVADLAKKARDVADVFRGIADIASGIKFPGVPQSVGRSVAQATQNTLFPGSALLGQAADFLGRRGRAVRLAERINLDQFDNQPKPAGAGTRQLIPQGKSGSGPRDDTQQRVQAVAAAVENAERQVLQALLGLATSAEAQASLKKQIVDREAAIEAARLSKEQADITADKGLAGATKQALVAKLEVAKANVQVAAATQKQAIDADAADAVAREQLAQQQAARDGEAQLLELQASLTLSERERGAIALRLVDIAFQKERADLEALIASKTAAEADKELARRKLATLNATQPLRAEQARREGSGPAQQVQGIVQGIRRQNSAADDARAMYDEIDRLRKQDVISEREAAQARYAVNEQYHQARLEGASQFFGNLAGLSESSNKTLHAIGKAAAIAQATIDGVLAVQKALASAPPPLNFAIAAATGVAAAINVAKIAGLRDGGPVAGPGGPRDDRVLRWLSNGEHVVNARAARQPGVRSVLDALNSGASLSALLPAPRLPAPLGLTPAPASGGDVHLHSTQTVSVELPDLARLIERNPRALKRAIEGMVRSGDLRIAQP